MTRDIVIIGAGGFGREVIDVLTAINDHAGQVVWRLLGVVDDAPSVLNLARLEQRTIPYLGTIDDAITRTPSSYSVGVGSPRARREIAGRLDKAGFSPVVLQHPAATLGSMVAVGAGSVICAGARLTTNIGLGQHVHVNLNATVGHDTTIGDFVSINPLASISGDCTVGDEAMIGVAASIINGVKVGPGAVVGGGACAVRDVEADATVVGVPAKQLGGHER